MSVEPLPDFAEFAEFAETLRGHRVQSARVVRRALRQAGQRHPNEIAEELNSVSRAFDGTLSDLDRAAEELRVQNEALFTARLELEGSSALFRDLFEFAPCAYIVTDTDTTILYANEAACTLLQRPKNALAGKPLICFVPLEDRSSFRAAVLRSNVSAAVTSWSAVLFPRGAPAKIACRMRVRPATTPGTQKPGALYWNITEETDEDLF
jgi:PAS domain S-box-containing protein